MPGGYIFCGGMQKQWGYLPETAAVITFPIPFSVAVYSIQSNAYYDIFGGGGYERYPYSASKNNMKIAYQEETTHLMYIAVGRQEQWGEATLNAAKNLPVSFSQAAYCAVGTPRGAVNTDNTIIQNISQNSVTFANYGYNGKCYFVVVSL